MRHSGSAKFPFLPQSCYRTASKNASDLLATLSWSPWLPLARARLLATWWSYAAPCSCTITVPDTGHLISGQPQVKDLALLLDLQLAKDRVQLLFTSIHPYFLLLGILQALPPLDGLLPQNQWISRPNAQFMWSTPKDPTKER